MNSLIELKYSPRVSAALNLFVYFRSSNGEVPGSLDDWERFRIQPHDAHLEHTTESQEKNTDNTDPKERLGSSPAPKKARVKKDFILVSSLGGPPEPSRHVSLRFMLYCLSNITPQ
jgi:hypothetical protein